MKTVTKHIPEARDAAAERAPEIRIKEFLNATDVSPRDDIPYSPYPTIDMVFRPWASNFEAACIKQMRTIIADRQWFEQSIEDIRRLSCAVIEAQKRGDELAFSLRAASSQEMMADLALYFETHAITP